jgi:ABC-type transporter Mla maintaining outer membrane lipid asymmetry ATPase subunit MlaF
MICTAVGVTTAILFPSLHLTHPPDMGLDPNKKGSFNDIIDRTYDTW